MHTKTTETKIFHIKFYCWHACRDLMKYKNMSFIQICFSSLYNYPVFFFFDTILTKQLTTSNVQAFDKFHHVLFNIRFRFSSFSKICKKVTTLKRNLPIYETSAQSGQKKRKKKKFQVKLNVQYLPLHGLFL